MRGTQQPENLRFTVHSCSGEDPEHPISELLFHNPQSRGWQSSRFCTYPQDITLSLEKPSKIRQLQILSHEFKIATRLEVHVGSASDRGSGDGNVKWRRLGGLSLDSNERSNFQARELKSVQLHAEADYLKIVIHQCHVNKLNIYNQVGFIALNLVGMPLDLSQSTDVHPSTSHIPAGSGEHYKTPAVQAASTSADLALDVNIDSQTAAKIRDLNAKKALAVEREDYDEAKVLKQAIERLKAVGAKVAQLEARKRAAVDREDYDTAKAIKADIDKLRNAAETSNPISGPATCVVARTFDDVPVGQRVIEATELPTETLPRDDSAEDSPVVDGRKHAMRSDSDFNRTPSQVYDDRPAQGRGSYVADGDPVEHVSRASLARMSIQSAAAPTPAGPAPSDFPSDLPPPEPLSGAQLKDVDILINMVGEYVVAALFSRVWQLREAALHHINLALSQQRLQDHDPREVLREVGKLVVRLSNDKVPNIFQASLKVLRALLGVSANGVHQRDMSQLMSDMVPNLVEKAGDANGRMHSAAVDMLLYLAEIKDAGLSTMTHYFTRPVKSQTAWRQVLGRLQLIGALLGKIEISKSNSTGFDLDAIMAFLAAAFTSANAEVRSAAVKLAVQVQEMTACNMHRYLPADLNPKLREQLESALSASAQQQRQGGNAASASCPSPSMGPSLVKSSSQQGAKQKRTPSISNNQPSKDVSKHLNGKHAAGSTKAPIQLQAIASSNGSYSAPNRNSQQDALPVSREQCSPVPAMLPGTQVDNESEVDDPSVYENDLRIKEKRFGPNHPQVATALANLAILYNQRNEFDKAEPLYTRALHIFESHYGPDHTEVAHTLTDLAVLHLERGDETVGRPLLERALRIQEKALGPNHPDVLAIREVLESEDDFVAV